MKHIVRDIELAVPVGGEIAIPSFMFSIFGKLSKPDLVRLFQLFRLDLQSRILGLAEQDLIKLQGKLDYVNELEIFFLGLLK